MAPLPCLAAAFSEPSLPSYRMLPRDRDLVSHSRSLPSRLRSADILGLVLVLVNVGPHRVRTHTWCRPKLLPI